MRALLLHPVQRGAGVQPAGEGDAHLLADRQFSRITDMLASSFSNASPEVNG
jgi:hypothetical protein